MTDAGRCDWWTYFAACAPVPSEECISPAVHLTVTLFRRLIWQQASRRHISGHYSPSGRPIACVRHITAENLFRDIGKCQTDPKSKANVLVHYLATPSVTHLVRGSEEW